MKTLSKHQKEFLLGFFKDEKYAGWKSIATKLLETGSCIVAGSGCIWNGGIGNFIETEDAEDAVDCTLYTFNLERFLSSEWFKENKKNHATVLFEKITELKQEHDEIVSL